MAEQARNDRDPLAALAASHGPDQSGAADLVLLKHGSNELYRQRKGGSDSPVTKPSGLMLERQNAAGSRLALLVFQDCNTNGDRIVWRLLGYLVPLQNGAHDTFSQAESSGDSAST